MKNFKKVVALSLALLMVIAAVVVSPVSAKAEGETSGAVTNLNTIQTAEINVLAHGYAPQVNWMHPDYNSFNWSLGMVLECDPATGVWEVIYTHEPGASADGTNSALAQEYGVTEDGKIKIIIICHSTATDAASYNFFAANSAVGTKFNLVGDLWGTIIDDAGNLKEGAITGLSFTLATDDDDTTGDDTTTDEGTTDEEIKDTGDNFVPMFVVLFAGLALVTVATVARKRA
jgi:hypothetical protein